MAYYDIALLVEDQDWLKRTIACASTEGLPDPQDWAVDRRWDIAAAPGFGDAYASALAAGVPNPGRDQSVISDGQILARVQELAGGAR